MSDSLNDQVTILLEESTFKTVPVFLSEFIHENTQQEVNSSQDLRLLILALIAYYVCLEQGFIPFEKDVTASNSSVEWGFNRNRMKIYNKCLPSNFKQQTHFIANLKLKNDDTKCILLMMRSGDALMTTLTSDRFKGWSLYLSASRYVPNVNKKNLASSFRDLADFSVELKNKLYGPIRNEILASRGQVYPGLMGLPDGLLDGVLKYLSKKDVRNLASTCSILHRETKSYKERHKRIS